MEKCSIRTQKKSWIKRDRTEEHSKDFPVRAVRTMQAVLVCIVIAILFLTGCGGRENYSIRIVVPAGSQEAFVYAGEEISPKKNSITIYAGEGLGDTAVILQPVGAESPAGPPVYLTPGMPAHMEAEQGEWFRIGVSVQNSGNEDIEVYVTVKDVELRIE